LNQRKLDKLLRAVKRVNAYRMKVIRVENDLHCRAWDLMEWLKLVEDEWGDGPDSWVAREARYARNAVGHHLWGPEGYEGHKAWVPQYLRVFEVLDTFSRTCLDVEEPPCFHEYGALLERYEKLAAIAPHLLA
jgi:hypothetical protein